MRYIFLLVLITGFIACNNSTKKAKDDAIVSPLIPPVDTLPPPSLKYDGQLKESWKWGDKSGENVLIAAYFEPYDDKDTNEFGEQGQTAKLYAAQYVKKDSGYSLVWKNEDRVKSCPFDVTCGFADSAIAVTDLDNDGISEVTYVIRLACRSDVSPTEMKLIMQEGKDKYELDGYSWLRISPEDKFAVTEADVNLEKLPGYHGGDDEYMKTIGRYKSEKGFATAPPAFLSFARTHWLKHVKEESFSNE